MQEGLSVERRKFSKQFKEQVVRECLETGSVPIVARKHDIRPNVVGRWVREHENGGLQSSKLHAPATNVTAEEYKQLLNEKKELQDKNEQLKKTLGEQTLEVAILRDLLKKASPHLRTK
jgi:transposase